MKKRCSGPCGKTLPESEFYKDPNKPRGLRYACKACDKERRNGRALGAETGTGKIKGSMAALVKLAKGRDSIDFGELCNRLDLSPVRTEQLLEDARAEGLRLRVAGNHVAIRPTEDTREIQTTRIAPTVGGVQRLGVISDLHFGSRHCQRAAIGDFMQYAYARGVRETLVPGDVVDGIYPFARFEQSHAGLDAQADDAIAHLPSFPGHSYHMITGNHDETFTDKVGIDVGPYLVQRFQKAGRGDLTCYGNRSAYLQLRGAVVHMWHPRGGAAYAKSYRLQKRIAEYAGGEKPQILLVGHWHQYNHLFERGVHGLLCPTFEGGGSRFGKSLGGAPAIGGLVIEYELTADGTMRSFQHEYRAYFERERPQPASSAESRIPIDVPGVRARAAR